MIAILVDDGIAPGATMRAAVSATRRHSARTVIVAAPVASVDGIETLRHAADDIVVELISDEFRSVGQFYGDFEPVSDDEVTSLLVRARTCRRHSHKLGRLRYGVAFVPHRFGVGAIHWGGRRVLPQRIISTRENAVAGSQS